MAARKVRSPLVTGTTSAPSRRMRPTLGAWRSMSIEPMYTVHGSPSRAHAAALATPCCPAPVSATMRLADRVVDLVRTGVCQVLALEPQPCAPARRQARRERERRGAACPAGELFGELRLKVALMQVLAHAPLEALERGDQRFRNVAAAERAEAAACVRERAGDQLGEQAGGIRQCGGGTHAGAPARGGGASHTARGGRAKITNFSRLFPPRPPPPPPRPATPQN